MTLRDHRVFNRGRQTQSDTKMEQVKDNIQGLFEKNVFDTAVVAEFISDPEEFLATTVEIDESSLGSSLRSKIKTSGGNKVSTMFDELTTGTKKVENPYLVQLMPKNSIIAYNITDAKNHSSPDPEIFFPFFPAHFSMPVKTGEHVWCFYENIGKKRVGYWVFRKSSTIQVDDLNYTFLERQIPISTLISTKQDPNTALNKGKFKTLVRNLGYKFEDFRAGGDGSGALKVDVDKLVADSISYKEEFIGEPVPRHSKKCSDLVLQGSNNTIITMTHLNRTETGTIILAAGKSMGTVASGELTVKNTRGDSSKSFEHDEIDKTTMLHSDEKIENEGSTDNSKASLTITEDAGGSILAQAANGSFLKMDSGDISLSRTSDFDYSNSQITLLDDNIDIKSARVNINDADEPYVKYSTLKPLLDKMANSIILLQEIVVSNPGLLVDPATIATATAAAATAATNGFFPGDEAYNFTVNLAVKAITAPFEQSALALAASVNGQPGKLEISDLETTGGGLNAPSPLGSETIFGS